MTQQELKNYRKAEIDLKRIEDCMAELRHKIESPNSVFYSDMPKSRGKHRDTSDHILKLHRLFDIYNRQWDALIEERIRIETAIAALPDPIERTIVKYRYIDGHSWEKICVKIGYQWTQTHHIHAKALRDLSNL